MQIEVLYQKGKNFYFYHNNQEVGWNNTLSKFIKFPFCVCFDDGKKVFYEKECNLRNLTIDFLLMKQKELNLFQSQLKFN